MKAIFVELPPFERYREHYMDDAGFHVIQAELIKNPTIGDVISGTGGLRKVRFPDPRRGKGKRGGIRIIYYWWACGLQFWLFTLYSKGEMNDLSLKERNILSAMLLREIQARKL